MSTSTVSEILTNNTYNPIGINKLKPIGPIGNNTQTNVIIDRLLEDYADLIMPEWKRWFAGKFRNIPFDQLHRFASESRQEGKDPKRLFAYKVGGWSKV